MWELCNFPCSSCLPVQATALLSVALGAHVGEHVHVVHAQAHLHVVSSNQPVLQQAVERALRVLGPPNILSNGGRCFVFVLFRPGIYYRTGTLAHLVRVHPWVRRAAGAAAETAVPVV